MSPATILKVLWVQGFTVTLTDNGRLKVSPSSTLHDAQRQLLRDHKTEIVELLASAHDMTSALLEAAMRGCDHHSDSEEARADMHRDCVATPPHLRPDLLAHFVDVYGAKPKSCSYDSHPRFPNLPSGTTIEEPRP